MSFHLSKWYLDGVADDGELRLGYAAELTAGALRVRYASVLGAAPSRAPRTETRLRGARLPEPGPESLRWSVPTLRLEGTWTRAGAAPLALELLDEPGALTWRCLLPRAAVTLEHGDAKLAMVGYAERVELRVPPWELPIDELRWGRAHVGAHTLVWIHARGPRPMRHLFVDGAAVDGDVGDDAVRTSALVVRLERRATLRDGDIGKTALARVPAARSLLSRHRLALRETKWLSRAQAGSDVGWAIHEVVQWR